jgi:hypothetical protein
MAAIAGIGRKPDTIEDRAVNITILRALPGEQVEKFRLRRDVPTMHLLRDRIAAWAGEHLTDKPPVLMPVELQDRAEDAWEPLISVGDAAGGDWPKLAREAAIVLDREAADNDGEQSLEVRLLADVQSVFAGTPDVTLLGSKVLLTELRKIDDAPWSELDFTSRKLALRLGKFEVKPRHNSAKTERGYHLEPCTTLSTGTSVQPVRNRPTRRLTCMKALDGSRTVRTAPVRNPSKCPQLVRTKPQVRALMDGSGRYPRRGRFDGLRLGLSPVRGSGGPSRLANTSALAVRGSSSSRAGGLMSNQTRRLVCASRGCTRPLSPAQVVLDRHGLPHCNAALIGCRHTSGVHQGRCSHEQSGDHLDTVCNDEARSDEVRSQSEQRSAGCVLP